MHELEKRDTKHKQNERKEGSSSLKEMEVKEGQRARKDETLRKEGQQHEQMKQRKEEHLQTQTQFQTHSCNIIDATHFYTYSTYRSDMYCMTILLAVVHFRRLFAHRCADRQPHIWI